MDIKSIIYLANSILPIGSHIKLAKYYFPCLIRTKQGKVHNALFTEDQIKIAIKQYINQVNK